MKKSYKTLALSLATILAFTGCASAEPVTTEFTTSEQSNLVSIGSVKDKVTVPSKEPERVIYENNQALKIEVSSYDLIDDTALVYRGENGLTIVTGCSHAGICNITEYAKEVCGDDRIDGIIGGFHLLEMNSQVAKTVDYLQNQHPRLLCPCHCTCFHARAAIQSAVPVREVCVGDILEID